jgi:tRNA threonylcarbamoyladenosine biosynthesis protein TsaE
MLIKTNNKKETKALGKMLAEEIKGGVIICLSGELGSGKTTFAQGFLQGLKIKGPYTSPTFVVMKQYKLAKNKNAYHIDAYRIKEKDILNLGWEEMIQNQENIILVEWAERIQKIIPANSLQIKFKWINENEREIIFLNK